MWFPVVIAAGSYRCESMSLIESFMDGEERSSALRVMWVFLAMSGLMPTWYIGFMEREASPLPTHSTYITTNLSEVVPPALQATSWFGQLPR